ncbi:hypothetical protein V8F06_004343 [Rhypophila decipiens]
MPPPNTPEEGMPAQGSLPRRISGEVFPERTRRPRPRVPTPPTSAPATVPPPAPSSVPRPPSGRASPTSDDPNADNVLAIDHQALEYTDPVDETLQCPICRTPFYKPVTTKTCGHTFCSPCLHRALELQPVCPIDRQPIDKSRDLGQTRVILDQLDRLKVKCPNKGCDHISSRDRLAAHYERYCDYTLVRCPDANCTMAIARMDAKPDAGCLHKDSECQYCNKTVVIADLEAHYDNDCSGHTAKCPHCSAIVVRHRMEKHIANDCPEAEIPCKSHTYGCPFRNKRRLIEQHEQNGCIHATIGKLAMGRLEDRMMINDLKNRIASLDARVRRTEQRQAAVPSIASTIPGSRASFVAGGNGASDFIPDLDDLRAGAAGMAPGPAGAGSPEDYMLAQFERMESQMEDLRKMVRDMDGHHSMRLLNDTMVLNDQITELTGKVNVLNMHTTWLMGIQRRELQMRAAGGAAGGEAHGGPRPGPSSANPNSGGGVSLAGSSSADGSGNGGGGGHSSRERSGSISGLSVSQRQHQHGEGMVPSLGMGLGQGRGENPPRL